MGTVRIRIGHNNNLIIVRVFHFKVGADPCPDRMNNRIDFFIFKNIFKFRFFSINHFTAERQNRLETSVTALLS